MKYYWLNMYSTWMRILSGGSKKTATGCFRLCSSYSVQQFKCISTYFALGCGVPVCFSWHVLKKMTFLHFLPHPVYDFQISRSYRIKADATLTTEQIFICKVSITNVKIDLLDENFLISDFKDCSHHILTRMHYLLLVGLLWL